MARNTSSMPPLPVLKLGFRKKRMSSMGTSVCSSHSTNIASTTNETTNAPTVCGAPHPLSGAWMSANTSDEMPTIESSAPMGSSFASSGSRDFGTRNQPPTSARAMIGRLIRNTEPNQKWVSRKPLMSGPIAPATPTVAAQIAIALARSPAGKTFTRIDKVDGMMNAAPTPISARHPISCPIVVACDAAAAPMKKVTSPNCSAPLRPNRSPSAPAENSSPAKTSEYAATTHCNCDSLAPRSRANEGSATFRLELATETISRLRQRTPRVHHRRSWTGSAVRAGGRGGHAPHSVTFMPEETN